MRQGRQNSNPAVIPVYTTRELYEPILLYEGALSVDAPDFLTIAKGYVHSDNKAPGQPVRVKGSPDR